MQRIQKLVLGIVIFANLLLCSSEVYASSGDNPCPECEIPNPINPLDCVYVGDLPFPVISRGHQSECCGYQRIPLGLVCCRGNVYVYLFQLRPKCCTDDEVLSAHSNESIKKCKEECEKNKEEELQENESSREQSKNGVDDMLDTLSLEELGTDIGRDVGGNARNWIALIGDLGETFQDSTTNLLKTVLRQILYLAIDFIHNLERRKILQRYEYCIDGCKSGSNCINAM